MSLLDFEQGQCKRIGAHLDSYLKGELAFEAAETVRRHLDACHLCSQAMAGRLRIKSLLQEAVMKEEAPPGLQYRIKRNIRRSSAPFRWTAWALAAAAAAVLIVGAFGVIRIASSPGRPTITEQALAGQGGHLLDIGLGDHVRCAIDHGMANRKFTREEMTRQLGADYADVVDLVSKTGGAYEVAVGHRCHVDGREFVHLILKNRTAAVSLIMTRKNGESFANGGLAARLEESGFDVYQNQLREFQVAGFETRDHLVFVVSALADRDNLQIARTLAPEVRDFLARLEARA